MPFEPEVLGVDRIGIPGDPSISRGLAARAVSQGPQRQGTARLPHLLKRALVDFRPSPPPSPPPPSLTLASTSEISVSGRPRAASAAGLPLLFPLVGPLRPHLEEGDVRKGEAEG